MSSTATTTNLKLPQYSQGDKPTWLGDMNNAFALIDEGYAKNRKDIDQNKQGVSTLSSELLNLKQSYNAQQNTLTSVTQTNTDIANKNAELERNYQSTNDKVAKLETAFKGMLDRREIIDLIYPVGIGIEFMADVDPNQLYNGTTWERVTGFTVGYDNSVQQFNEIGKTGGRVTNVAKLEGNSYAKINIATGSCVLQGRAKGLENSYIVDRQIKFTNVSADGTTRSTNSGIYLGGTTDEMEILPPYRVTAKWVRTL